MPRGDVSSAVAVICGSSRTDADRYDVRNDALRSIARLRELGPAGVGSLMEYVASEEVLLHPAREAALRNDVLNLLRSQERMPDGLPELLMGIALRGRHDATIVDYAIQHLGALQHELETEEESVLVRDLFAVVGAMTDRPYAGTALYALADSRKLSAAESERLRRLTVSACSPGANPLVRLSAIQLAGQRGYREVLPEIKAILAGDRRDAVLDTVAVGALGLLGGMSDIDLLTKFSARGGSRLAFPVETAVKRIRERTE